MNTRKVFGVMALAAAILASQSWLSGTQVEAAQMQKSLVRVVNSTEYKVKYTVYDDYGPETGWLRPGESKDWTSAHTGKIHTKGSGYDANGKEVLTWEYQSWDVDKTPKFRITLTK